VGFQPVKFSQISPGGITYAVAENTDGRGSLHGFYFSVAAGTPGVLPYVGSLAYQQPIVDLDGDFVAFPDGTIQEFQTISVFGSPELSNVQKIVPPAEFTGGLNDIDLNADHTQLLAVSSAGRVVTVYSVAGTRAAATGTISLSTIAGKPLQARFIDDGDSQTDDSIVVLNSTPTNAQFTLLSPPTDTITSYTVSATFASTALLKQFDFIYNPTTPLPDIAALSGTLNKFTVVTGFTAEQDFPLPFANKEVTLTTGHGGFGLDFGTKLGKGGAGGSITNLNIDAQRITITTGDGGNSTSGAGGAGGSISNAIPSTLGLDEEGNTITIPGTFKTSGGTAVVPKLLAEEAFAITVGDGGTPTGAGSKSAAGGAGGSMNSLDITLVKGNIELTAGAGGAGKGGAGGGGGNIARVTALAEEGGLIATAGMGGNANATTGAGGVGGAITNLRFTLSLDAEAETHENPYAVTLISGKGGDSMGAVGGAGGEVNGVILSLDSANRTLDDPNTPNDEDNHADSTVTVVVTAGDAGDGLKGGGLGGSIRSFTSTSVLDQSVGGGRVLPFVVMSLQAGKGGGATQGNGGAGGSIVLSRPISGVTLVDPDQPGANFLIPALSVVAGNGGNGSGKGGAGGSVSGLVAQNSAFVDGSDLTATELFSAEIIAGDGGSGDTGNGGAAGAIINALVAVNGGFLGAFGGTGGDSTNAKGGVGGNVSGSEFGLVDSGFALGMDIEGGGGGAGKTAGGAGGALSKLKVNTPQSTFNLSAFLIGGAGGMATSAAGIGGKGGDVNGITQAKDYNSSINLVQAGNGGDNPLGQGGAGGNVSNVKTVGFLGRRSDSAGTQLGVFDSGIAQGVFSGRGGDGSGTNDGVNGSISNITARQIAAMAAAPDLATGLFAVASKISNVKAALIGFDADGDGNCDDSTNTPIVEPNSPALTKPTDGFILAHVIANVIIDGQLAVAADPFVFVV
jgi:hypothetical protein